MCDVCAARRFPALTPSKPYSAMSDEEFDKLVANVERTYWEVVEKGSAAVQVEYGNDLDTSTYGSGFPKPSTRRRRPSTPDMLSPKFYRRTGWNLLKMPTEPASVLRHVQDDLNGVTVPWLYYGMLFATFAWHVEDNYFYSMNYMHTGAPKTWYGIGSAHADQFETVLRQRLRCRFEKDRDLLYHVRLVGGGDCSTFCLC